jgi:hypothetical protein
MIHSFTVTFGVKYSTDMVTSVPPYKLSILLTRGSVGCACVAHLSFCFEEN